MKLLLRVWKSLYPSKREPVIEQAPISPVPPANPTVRRRNRALSPAMTQAIAILAERPDISSAELAQSINVSPGYARTLLRKARQRPEESSPAAVALVEGPPEKLDVVVSDLKRRLEETETQIQHLSLPLPPQAINYNRRTQVLRLRDKGRDVAAIAAQTGIVRGEIEFILKVDQLQRRMF